MRFSSVFFIAPFIWGCASTQPIEPVKENIQLNDKFSHVNKTHFRGQFGVIDGKEYFKSCASNNSFSVISTKAQRAVYHKINVGSEIPVYIEFSGEIIFNGVLKTQNNTAVRLDKIQHMAAARSSLQCAKPTDNFLFKARGDSPYWRLNIDNEQILFSSKASNQAYNVNPAQFKSNDLKHIISSNQQQQHIEIATIAEDCYSNDNKAYWGYKNTTTTQEKKYSGCGEFASPSDPWKARGQYVYLSDNANIKLTLKDNFDAHYQLAINGKKTLKTGFWKTNSANELVVLLTRQGNKNIRQEVVFSRNNDSLQATIINKNGIATPVTETPFILKKVQQTAPNNKITETQSAPLQVQNIVPSNTLDVGVQKLVRYYFKAHKTDPKKTRFSVVKYDLNADGVDEAIVLLDWCSEKNGCELLIFDGQKANKRTTSRISQVQLPIIISTEKNYRWQDMLVAKKSGWVTLKFDGELYPSTTHKLKVMNKLTQKSTVTLFSNGAPDQWFPVKK